MKNLDQIRAKNALQASTDASYSGENNGEVAKKLPARIQANGLLAAAAFALDAKKGHLDIFNKAVIPHLKEMKWTDKSELREFVADLCTKDSTHLRAVTAETLAYLTFLRRFAVKDAKPSSEARS